jgi:hypothetical protein
MKQHIHIQEEIKMHSVGYACILRCFGRERECVVYTGSASAKRTQRGSTGSLSLSREREKGKEAGYESRWGKEIDDRWQRNRCRNSNTTINQK